LALTADFFADRSMWGLSHVVRFPDVGSARPLITN
jgi:hypothetical protein